MREIVILSRLFFLFLGSMRLATGRPVGPILAVLGLVAFTSFLWFR